MATFPSFSLAGVEARPEEGTGGQACLLYIVGDRLGSLEVQPDRPALVALFVQPGSRLVAVLVEVGDFQSAGGGQPGPGVGNPRIRVA
jgi:hypothetical protein